MKVEHIKRIAGSSGRFDVKVTGPDGTFRESIKYRDIEAHLSAHSGRPDAHNRAALTLWSAIAAAFPDRQASLASLQQFAARAECADLVDGARDRTHAWEALFYETNVVDSDPARAMVIEEDAGDSHDELSGLRAKGEDDGEGVGEEAEKRRKTR